MGVSQFGGNPYLTKRSLYVIIRTNVPIIEGKVSFSSEPLISRGRG
jgi:hypothetical protein